jgi:hypothetical protein
VLGTRRTSLALCTKLSGSASTVPPRSSYNARLSVGGGGGGGVDDDDDDDDDDEEEEEEVVVAAVVACVCV